MVYVRAYVPFSTPSSSVSLVLVGLGNIVNEGLVVALVLVALVLVLLIVLAVVLALVVLAVAVLVVAVVADCPSPCPSPDKTLVVVVEMECNKDVKCSAGAKGDVLLSGDVVAVGDMDEKEEAVADVEEEGVDDDGRVEAVVGGLEGSGSFGLLLLVFFTPLR